MSDRGAFAEYFKIRQNDIPMCTEELIRAKQKILQLCARSRSREIRYDMVSPSGATGPLYVHRLNDFAATRWDARIAAANSTSLQRAISSLESL